MDDWKGLPVEEKVKQVAVYRVGVGRCSDSERRIVKLYAEALNDGNAVVVAEYESFGDSLRSIVENYAEYRHGRIFYGFDKKAFTEAGWLVKPEWLDVERFEFGRTIKKAQGLNSITLGHGPNGQWTYAVRAGNFNGGYGSGLSVWDDGYSSRQECLAEGLKELLAWHDKQDKKHRIPTMLAEIRSMLDYLTGEKRGLLSTFELAVISGVGVSHA
jgi:hypothetical protein